MRKMSVSIRIVPVTGGSQSCRKSLLSYEARGIHFPCFKQLATHCKARDRHEFSPPAYWFSIYEKGHFLPILSLSISLPYVTQPWVTTGSYNNLAQPPVHTYHMILLLIWQRATLAPVTFSILSLSLSEWKERAGSNKSETSLPLCCFSAARAIVVLTEDTKSQGTGKSPTRENEIKKKNKRANQTRTQRNSGLKYGREQW